MTDSLVTSLYVSIHLVRTRNDCKLQVSDLSKISCCNNKCVYVLHRNLQNSDGWFRKVVSIRGYNTALLPSPKMEGKRKSWVCNLLSSQAGWHLLFLWARVRKGTIVKIITDLNMVKQENYYHTMRIRIKDPFRIFAWKLVLQNEVFKFWGPCVYPPPYLCVIAESGRGE